MKAALVALLACVCAALAFSAPAAALSIDPYGGQNPFRCETQRLGTGVDFEDARADPLCVQYDKTNQDLVGLGVVDFLINEPARIAVALDKCFYFQRDHWRGSVLEDGALETYHWRGAYFFDLARGVAGLFVEELRLAGFGGYPVFVDLVPEPFRRFVHPTGGGGTVSLGAGDPRCVKRVDTPSEARRVYRRGS